MASKEVKQLVPEVNIKLYKEMILSDVIQKVINCKQYGAATLTQYKEAVDSLRILVHSMWGTKDSEREINVLNQTYNANMKKLEISGNMNTKAKMMMEKNYTDSMFEILMKVVRDRNMWGREAEYSEIGLEDD